MQGFLTFLFVVGCILAFITVVGHGLWIAIAFIFRKITGDDPSINEPNQTSSNASVDSLKKDLEGTARELQRLRRRKLITQEQFYELLRLIDEDHVRLLNKPLPSSLKAAPGAKPTTQVIAATARTTPPPQDGKASPFSPKTKPSPKQDSSSEEIILAEAVEVDKPSAPPIAAVAAPSSLDQQQTSLHPLDRNYTEEPASKTSGGAKAQISRTMSEVLKSFMEDKNIRWVELLSGVLIVVCATGLVISLKSVLEKIIPYFPSLLFLLFTAAIHAAGIYTLRSWKLKTTSRGMLVIGTLLIPLNFLAAVAFSKSGGELRSVANPVYLLAITIALLSFSTMMFFTSRALLGKSWRGLWFAVLGPSAAILMINRQNDPSGTFLLAASMIALPLATYAGSIGEYLYQAMNWRRISLRRAEHTFLLLGLSLFSFLASVWLIVLSSSEKGIALARLSPWLSIAGATVLAIGLLIHHRTLSNRLSNIRTTGTALAILGGFLLVMMLAFAWPQPELLMAVGAINGALLIGMALFGRLPLLHGAGVACLAIAYLIGFHYLQGAYVDIDGSLGRRIVATMLRSDSSIALTIFSLLMGGVGVLFSRSQRRSDALGFFLSSAALCALSAVIAAFVGFHPRSSPDQVALATPILAFNAVAGLIASRLILDQRVTWGVVGLTLIALFHAFVWNQPLQEMLQRFPLIAEWKLGSALLCQGLIGTGIAWTSAWRNGAPTDKDKAGSVGREFIIPLSCTSMAASVAGAAILLFSFKHSFTSEAIYITAFSLVWLAGALIHRSWELFSVFQVAATGAVIFCCAAYGQSEELLQENFLDPPHLLLQFGVLAVWCMIWPAVRRGLAIFPTAMQIMLTPRVTVDQITLYALATGLGVYSFLACWPGVFAEMGANGGASVYLTTLAQTAQASGVWLVLMLLTAALFTSLWERPNEASLTSLFAIAAIGAMFFALRMSDTVATASALRWSLAVYTLLAACVIWARRQLLTGLDKLGWKKLQELPTWTLKSLIGATFLLGATPVVMITTWTVLQVSLGVALGGPTTDSFFDSIGPSASFAVPLMVLVTVMLGFAIRQRESVYASAGSALLQYVVCLAVLLPVYQSGRSFDVIALIELLQWNSLALAGYALTWLLLRPWIATAEETSEEGEVWRTPLGIQIVFMLSAAGLMTLWAILGVFISPETLPPGLVQFGQWPSYGAMALSAAAFAWHSRELLYRESANLFIGFTFALSAFVAISFDSFDATRTLLSYHVLTMVWVVLSATAAGVACWLATNTQTAQEKNNSPLKAWTTWASTLGGLVVLLALRGSLLDPLAPAMTGGPVFIVGLAAAALGLFHGKQLFAYVSALLAMITASLVFVEEWPVIGLVAVGDFVHLNLVSVTLVGIGWLAVEISLQQRKGISLQSNFTGLSVHRTIAWLSLGTILLIACGRVLLAIIREGPNNGFILDLSNSTAILCVLILGPLVFGLLWDRWAKYALPAMFIWGGSGTLFCLDLLNLTSRETFFGLTLSGALYFALVCYLWRQGAHLANWAGLLGVPDPIAHLQRASRWLPLITLAIGSPLALAALGIVLGYDSRAMRIGAGCVPLAIAFAFGSLAQKERRSTLQFLSLLSVALSAIYLSWADMNPSIDGVQWVNRLIRLLTVLSVMSFLYGAVLVRLLSPSSDWFASSRRAAISIGAGAFISLVATLTMEAMLFDPVAGIAISSAQVVVAAVVLGGLTAALLSLALLPGRDPLALSEKGRMFYVYGAQATAALTFAHIYLCRPMWFPGFAKDYWPFIVMGIAFAGVGVGELFQRKGLRVLAEPLHRTGTFLPLLPAIGWWIIASETDQSLVLFSVGLLYVLASFTQKSLVSGLAAAVFGNAALWSLLNETEWSITAHPQFWLIPPALSVLAAAQMNRSRLPPSQLAALRYVCIIVIYLSSTGEMFITGIGESVWPPIILMALSIGGAFAGIAFRIRAFLYLGSSFLMLSLVSMVWHASIAIEHTWPWWAFGTVVGISILIVIMFFEKKRDEINNMIQKMRDWEQ